MNASSITIYLNNKFLGFLLFCENRVFHAHVRVAAEACWGGGVCMWAVVLQCAVARADGGGWTVVAEDDDGGGVHACLGPTLSSHVDSGARSSDIMSCISLFKKLL
jgi:hypothetical protein